MHANRLIVSLLVAYLLLTGAAMAASDGWRLFRHIHLPAGTSEGPVAVVLDTSVIEKCRPDLADVRILSGDGAIVPVTVETPPRNNADKSISTRITRMARRPGNWTDIFVDKSGKVLSRAVTIQARAKDFTRKVELRGSDNGREFYVLRMDGLIAARSKPFMFRDLTIDHPLSNFQYLHIRVLDGDQPPLKIDGIGCEPPVDEDSFTAPLSIRTIENRTSPSSKATTIIADLGQKRFPLKSIRIATRSPSFVKQYVLSGSASPTSESWNKIAEGTFYRIRHEDAVKEGLTSTFASQPVRFIMLEIAGPTGPSIEVDEISATGTLSYAVFQYKPGVEYKLLYDNPAIEHASVDGSAPRLTPHLVSASSGVRLGQAEKNIAIPIERKSAPGRTEERSYSLGAAAAATLVLVCVLIVWAVIRWRRLRRSRRFRTARIYNVK